MTLELFMYLTRIAFNGITGIAVAILSACAAQQKPVELKPEPAAAQQQMTGVQALQRPSETPDKIVNDFYRFDSMQAAAKNGADAQVAQFLSTAQPSAMTESIRTAWLKNLGTRGDVAQFRQQYVLLPEAGRDTETKCYAAAFGIEQNSRLVNDVLESGDKLSAGCFLLLQKNIGSVNQSRAWRRVRILLAADQVAYARTLAAALGSPLENTDGAGAQENQLRSVISTAAQKTPQVSAVRLQQMAGSLTGEQAGFGWGVLATAYAKDQQFDQALALYAQADRSQLTQEHFDWFARSALRGKHWQTLDSVIASMPESGQRDATWLYWRGRALAAQGHSAEAQALYRQAAQTGRNFYAVLATEELGQRISTQNNVAQASAAQVEQISKDGAVHRALSLFHTSLQNQDWKMRRQAQNEWRYATREMNEPTLLAAAQLAYNHQFYEMAIYSADKTNNLLNYNLRYITPYRDLVQTYSRQHGVDAAWVYGLIRQESRFVMGAQSSVGAQGLMQVMPATAREIARKIGMDSQQLYTMEGNIRMGTWYMADARSRLQNNEVLATAGYNAGPGRARKWQGRAMEGAIYAETIPFSETRDYVKKVMTNAVYYASIMQQPNTSLKQRMGTVPGR